MLEDFQKFKFKDRHDATDYELIELRTLVRTLQTNLKIQDGMVSDLIGKVKGLEIRLNEIDNKEES